MIAFPCHRERVAAAALLLLSSNCNDSRLCFDEDDTDDDDSLFMNFTSEKTSFEESFVSNESKARSLSIVTDDDSSEQIKKCRLKINSVAARFHPMKVQVVRKRRSKHYRISDCQDLSLYKHTSSMPSLSMQEGTISTREASSCLSSSSSAISNARNMYMTAVRREEMEMKKHVFSPHIRRRADAILRFLSCGYASEMRIRLELGDSPDTSKALRMLLKREEINRSGAGGRSDPFIYMISR